MRGKYSIRKDMNTDVARRDKAKVFQTVDDEHMTLIYQKTRERVRVGDFVSNRNYQNCAVEGGKAPTYINSPGKVYVRIHTWRQEFDPSVFDLKWVATKALI